MKTLVRCVGCLLLVGLYKTYKVKVKDTANIPGVPRSQARDDEYTGYLCKPCAEIAGYKTKRGEE